MDSWMFQPCLLRKVPGMLSGSPRGASGQSCSAVLVGWQLASPLTISWALHLQTSWLRRMHVALKGLWVYWYVIGGADALLCLGPRPPEVAWLPAQAVTAGAARGLLIKMAGLLSG